MDMAALSLAVVPLEDTAVGRSQVAQEDSVVDLAVDQEDSAVDTAVGRSEEASLVDRSLRDRSEVCVVICITGDEDLTNKQVQVKFDANCPISFGQRVKTKQITWRSA